MLVLINFLISFVGNAGILLFLLILISQSTGKHVKFPPQRKDSKQFWAYWTLVIISYASIFLLAILDWRSIPVEYLVQLPLGIILIIIGSAIMIGGALNLSMSSSVGLKGSLITRGLYKYSRNPQYVGNIILLIGVKVISSSILTLIVCILGNFWTILLPFAEEPWLKERFREEYIEYCRKVRRFI